MGEVLTKTFGLIMFVAVAACGNQPANTVAANEPTATAPAAPDAPQDPACVLPRLDFADTRLGVTEQGKFAENFRLAFDKACGEKLLGAHALVDPRSADQATLFVTDAPEANIVSIYFNPENKPPRTLIEVPFGSPPQNPSADDFHEAIFCAVKGASAKEQEDSGRCLPD